MKVVLTGADGMLGSDIQKVFSDIDIIPYTLKDFDVTDLEKSGAYIRNARPDYVIHAAAFTDVDRSEQNHEEAYLINGIGTRNIVMACEEMKCPLIYISTDYVFDGLKGEAYMEWDKQNPVNKYGISKLLGEQFVLSLTNRFYIVRTSWLYGKNGKNFVDTIIRLLSEKDEIDVVNDQFGSPTYTYDLAVKLRELMGRGYGIYHITNTSHCSWHEFAVEIAKIKRINKKINSTTSDKFKRPAKRPSFSVLGNTMLKLEGIKELRPWKEALADYLRE